MFEWNFIVEINFLNLYLKSETCANSTFTGSRCSLPVYLKSRWSLNCKTTKFSSFMDSFANCLDWFKCTRIIKARSKTSTNIHPILINIHNNLIKNTFQRIYVWVIPQIMCRFQSKYNLLHIPALSLLFRIATMFSYCSLPISRSPGKCDWWNTTPRKSAANSYEFFMITFSKALPLRRKTQATAYWFMIY